MLQARPTYTDLYSSPGSGAFGLLQNLLCGIMSLLCNVAGAVWDVDIVLSMVFRCSSF